MPALVSGPRHVADLVVHVAVFCKTRSHIVVHLAVLFLRDIFLDISAQPRIKWCSFLQDQGIKRYMRDLFFQEKLQRLLHTVHRLSRNPEHHVAGDIRKACRLRIQDRLFRST